MRGWWLVGAALLGCGGGSDGPGRDGGGGGSGPLTPDELNAACVVLGSCFGDDGVSDCTEDMLNDLSNDLLHCLAEARSCETALACNGVIVTTDPSCPPMDACDGNTVVLCFGGQRYEQDCDSFGAVCTDGIDGHYCAEVCTGDPVCDGDVLDPCGSSDTDCTRFGASCAGGRCTDGTMVACTGADRCDGAALVTCMDGFELHVDCGALLVGSTCRTGPTGASAFCGTADECGASDKGGETCAGNVLTFCARGDVVSIDCTTLGFTSCSGTRCL